MFCFVVFDAFGLVVVNGCRLGFCFCWLWLCDCCLLVVVW